MGTRKKKVNVTHMRRSISSIPNRTPIQPTKRVEKNQLFIRKSNNNSNNRWFVLCRCTFWHKFTLVAEVKFAHLNEVNLERRRLVSRSNSNPDRHLPHCVFIFSSQSSYIYIWCVWQLLNKQRSSPMIIIIIIYLRLLPPPPSSLSRTSTWTKSQFIGTRIF